jgi:hypothetical protein
MDQEKVQETEKKEEDPLRKELELSSPSDLYQASLDLFESYGAQVIFDYTAKNLSFHTLYKYEPLDSIGVVKGLKFPSNFKILLPADTDFLTFIQRKFINSNTAEELREFAAPLIIYRGGRSADIIDHALALETLKAIKYNRCGSGEYKLGIAYSPSKCFGSANSEVRAFVPELDWFDKSIRELKFEDIIKIFPPHEAQMMKLIIGRAAVGRTGSVHPGTNEVLIHGFRKAGVIVGEPGIGKTLTLNGLIDAFKFLGYSVANMGDFGARFNQGAVVTSHLAFNDDLTLKSLESMLSAHSFKSVVTGGTEKVESKGLDAVEVVSNTVILANCNEWQPNMIYNLDIGAISRLAPISTYRQFELKNLNAGSDHNLHPAEHIPYLAQKYDVSERALYCKVIRDCADYFLGLVKKHPSEVHFESERIMPFLRIQMNKNAMDVLLRFAFMAYAIRYERLSTPWLPELTMNSLGEVIEALRFMSVSSSAYNFRTTLKQDWENVNRSYDHYWWAMRKMLITSIDQAYETYIKTRATKDVAMTTEEVFKSMRLKDGVSVAGKITYIIRAWEKIRGEVDVIYEDALRVITRLQQSHDNQNEDVLDLFDQDLNPTCNSEYLYSSSYDPSKL